MLVVLSVSSGWCGEEYLTDPALEPTEFRGLKWQQTLESAPNMTELYREEDGSEITCSRKNEDLSFGKAKLSSIEYIFSNGKLSKISVVAKGKENEDALFEEAYGMFGHETVRNGEDYLWRFSDVAVMFSREPDEQSVLFYQYIGFLRERNL